MTRAAIMQSFDSPLLVADVEVSPPGHGEVKVQITASRICDVDLELRSRKSPITLPLIPGHEASGIITGVGLGVAGLSEGDHVVLSGLLECGECYWCRRGEGFLCPVGQASSEVGTMMDGTHRAHHNGQALSQMRALGTFADEAVVSARSVIPIHTSLDLNIAALFGCALLSGVGAATRAASIHSGDTVAVIGPGSIARYVLQGARLARAGRILAVRNRRGSTDSEVRYGATDFVNTADGDTVEQLKDLTYGRGADVVIDTVGSMESILQSINATRRGGQTIIVGIHLDDPVIVALDARSQLVQAGRTIKGCWYGSTRPREDVPILLELYENGALLLDESAVTEIPLELVNDGLRMVGDDVGSEALIVNCLRST